MNTEASNSLGSYADKALVGLVILALALVGAFAARADGFSTDVIRAHDGAAWLLSGDTNGTLLVSVNGITQETSVQRAIDADPNAPLDIHQNGDVALLESAGSLYLIDSATAEVAQQGFDLPGGRDAQAIMGGETVAIWGDDGGLQLATPASSFTDEQEFRFDGPIDVSVSETGTTWVLEHESAAVTAISTERVRSEPISIGTSVPAIDFTIVGETAVVATDTELVFIAQDSEPVRYPYEDSLEIVRLQAAGSTARLVNGEESVVASTSAGLSAFSLTDGTVRHIVELPFPLRASVPPVVAAGCAYGVGEQVWVHGCEDREGVSEATEQTMIEPRLRVVRDLVFFEDWRSQVLSVWPPGSDQPVEIEPLAPDAATEEDDCGDEAICADGEDDETGDGRGAGGDGLAAGETQRDQTNTGVDEPPIAVDDAFTVVSGQSQVWDVLGNDQEPDGQPLGVILGEVDAGLSVSLLADRRVAVSTTSPPGTQLTFTYRATDGRFQSDFAIVTIEVISDTTAAPVLVSDEISVHAGRQGTLNVLANDVDDDPLVLLDVVTPSDFTGIVTSDIDGWVWITPTDADVGTHRLEYTAGDGAQEATATLLIEVLPDIPAPPVATTDFVELPWGTSATVDLLANDLDPNGDALFISGPPRIVEGQRWATIAPVDGGVFQVSTTGEEPNQVQHAIWEYTIDDRQGGTDEGLVRVMIVPPSLENRPPVPIDDRITVLPGESAVVNVLGNDTDPDPLDILTMTGEVTVSEPTLQVVQISPTSVRVTAAPNTPSGIHRATYSVSDGAGAVAAAQLVVVVPVVPEVLDVQIENLPPIVTDDRTEQLQAGQSVIVGLPEPQVIQDPEGRALEVGSVRVSDGSPVVVRLVGEPRNYGIEVTAPLDFQGTAEVSYLVTDDAGNSTAGRFTVNVLPAPANNTRPFASDDRYTTTAGQTLTFDPLQPDSFGSAPDSDPDGDAIVLDRIDAPGLNVSILESGQIEFRSEVGQAGTVSFSYSIVDDGVPPLVSLPATVVIQVAEQPPVNRPPIAVSESLVIEVETGPTNLQVLSNDSDPDPGDTASLVIVNLDDPSGRFEPVQNEAGQTVDLQFTALVPDAGGIISARYDVSDSSGAISEQSATVAVEVPEIPDVPEPLTLLAGQVAPVSIFTGETSDPIDVVSIVELNREAEVTLVSATAEAGTVEIVGDTIVYTASSDPGVTTITYEVQADGVKTTGTIIVEVNAPLALPPIAAADSLGTIVAGTEVTLPVSDVLSNDRDSLGQRGIDADLEVVSVSGPTTGQGNVALNGGTISLTANGEGAFVFNYTIEDIATGATATSTVTFVVEAQEPINTPPVGRSTVLQTVSTDDTIEVDLSLFVDDAEAGTEGWDQTLQYQEPRSDGTGSVTLRYTADSSSVLQVTAQEPGDVQIVVPVSDGEFSTEITLELTIDAVETIAVVNAPDRALTIAAGDESAFLNLLDGTDGVRVELVSGPGELDQDTGTYRWTRTLTDGGAEQATATYRIQNSEGEFGEAGTIAISAAERVPAPVELIDAPSVTLVMQADETVVARNLLTGGSRVEFFGGAEPGSLNEATGDWRYERGGADTDFSFQYIVFNADGLPGTPGTISVEITEQDDVVDPDVPDPDVPDPDVPDPDVPDPDVPDPDVPVDPDVPAPDVPDPDPVVVLNAPTALRCAVTNVDFDELGTVQGWRETWTWIDNSTDELTHRITLGTTFDASQRSEDVGTSWTQTHTVGSPELYAVVLGVNAIGPNGEVGPAANSPGCPAPEDQEVVEPPETLAAPQLNCVVSQVDYLDGQLSTWWETTTFTPPNGVEVSHWLVTIEDGPGQPLTTLRRDTNSFSTQQDANSLTAVNSVVYVTVDGQVSEPASTPGCTRPPEELIDDPSPSLAAPTSVCTVSNVEYSNGSLDRWTELHQFTPPDDATVSHWLVTLQEQVGVPLRELREDSNVFELEVTLTSVRTVDSMKYVNDEGQQSQPGLAASCTQPPLDDPNAPPQTPAAPTSTCRAAKPVYFEGSLSTWEAQYTFGTTGADTGAYWLVSVQLEIGDPREEIRIEENFYAVRRDVDNPFSVADVVTSARYVTIDGRTSEAGPVANCTPPPTEDPNVPTVSLQAPTNLQCRIENVELFEVNVAGAPVLTPWRWDQVWTWTDNSDGEDHHEVVIAPEFQLQAPEILIADTSVTTGGSSNSPVGSTIVVEIRSVSGDQQGPALTGGTCFDFGGVLPPDEPLALPAIDADPGTFTVAGDQDQFEFALDLKGGDRIVVNQDPFGIFDENGGNPRLVYTRHTLADARVTFEYGIENAEGRLGALAEIVINVEAATPPPPPPDPCATAVQIVDFVPSGADPNLFVPVVSVAHTVGCEGSTGFGLDLGGGSVSTYEFEFSATVTMSDDNARPCGEAGSLQGIVYGPNGSEILRSSTVQFTYCAFQ